jgi:outer membrane cobalamin receptor
MRKILVRVITVLCFSATSSEVFAAIFGSVAGFVEDPQHRPVPQAQVTIRSAGSGWQQDGQTDGEGRFLFAIVPAGDYTVSAVKPGFQVVEQQLVVRSDTVTSISLMLPIGPLTETIAVTAVEGVINPKTVTTESLVTRRDIDEIPGALRSNSLDAITQFVPGAVLVHDQLHIRGGHQMSWLVDGVPVPNTNIASNIGPQFDPKDIETIEIERGGYSADLGDRTYGVFNVVTRSGLERDRQAEVVANYGTFRETNDQFSLGDHSDRRAYYASINGNFTRLGLETPGAETLHDRGTGLGGFGSLMYRPTAADQLRLVASVRGDQYQIPNTPDAEAAGIDDRQQERDGFVNLSWLRTFGSNVSLTVSPFYHYNRAAFDGGPTDPVITTDHRTSQYVGGQAVLALERGRHTGRVGVYGFYQRDDQIFGLQSDQAAFAQTLRPTGHVEVAFAQDRFAATDWLTLNGGVRLTSFSGLLSETAVSPRVGAAIRLPRAWVVRAFYGRYYQSPPLATVAGPLLGLAVDEGFGFLPLRGERDEQYEASLGIPLNGWALEVSQFQTNARNFFDHDVIGNSNIFLPLTIDRARIRGSEVSVRSPRGRRIQVHAAYAHQYVEGRGAVSGGLTSFEPPSDDYFFLDHDQRDTLTGGIAVRLPADVTMAASIAYGSGFLQGDGPDHLPAHTIFNLQGSKAIGKQWSVTASALNVGDTRFLIDQSNTFGGTHYASPRQLSAGVRYRFRY